MAEQQISRQLRDLRKQLHETGTRIRRYTLDPRLRMHVQREKESDKPAAGNALTHFPGSKHSMTIPAELSEELRKMADKAWEKWLSLNARLNALPDAAARADVLDAELAWLQLDRDVDLIQRELISRESSDAGVQTVVVLGAVLMGVSAIYPGHPRGARFRFNPVSAVARMGADEVWRGHLLE